MDSKPLLVAPQLVPQLRDLCIKAVAGGFQARPELDGLDDTCVQRVVDNLSLDLPLDIAAVLIAGEGYWQRRAAARWKNCDTLPHGSSWKQLYMERNLQEAIEQFDPATGEDLSQLRKLMAFSRRFVHCLRLQQLPSHLDLFDTMQLTPTQLSISYNPRGLGMNYSSNSAGMRLSDCRMLARALASTETLVVLNLCNNSLDDDMARMLASGLADNISVTHLNLSHNSISDRGVRALARLLDEHSILCSLDLSGNQLQGDSGRALARAVSHSRALLSLNLRLNRLGDEGCAAICEALAHSWAAAAGGAAGSGAGGAGTSAGAAAAAGTPLAGSGPGGSSSNKKDANRAAAGPCVLQRLNLSSNGSGVGLVPAVCSMLRSCGSLQELDLSCNQLGERLSTDLLSATSVNTELAVFDVRGCGVGAEAEGALRDLMLAREAEREAAKLFA